MLDDVAVGPEVEVELAASPVDDGSCEVSGTSCLVIPLPPEIGIVVGVAGGCCGVCNASQEDVGNVLAGNALLGISGSGASLSVP